ncbi:MAG: hypothetical protein ABDI19_09235 [Armatimonadota bacterium]
MKVTYRGTVRGYVIELDEPVELPEGTRVRVDIAPEETPRKNSPRAWLQLVGTLTEEEADTILRFVREECRRIEPELWTNKK